MDTTPVGVGLGVVPVQEDVDAPSFPDDPEDDAPPVSVGPDSLKFNDGQQSGRSSEQPTRGTSTDPPSGKVMMVYCGILHLRKVNKYAETE